ncbi:cytochrome p450 [Ceraceosorus bombacis]|uniref:Cytochrome p450 n=1 Tax=Ceraceosorus bombacis TaxID=401625 RepID=A0A0P1BD64_9BASI|nr:cytochrome p450 [Ceraceosorus bombacis]
MSDRIVAAWQASPLASLSHWQLVAVAAIVFPTVAVVLNVIDQLLLPKKPSLPPHVFHLFPWIGSAVVYGMDPYHFFESCREKYGDVYTFTLLGRNMTVALGPKGSNLIFNGRITEVSAEDAYTHLTTPVFGKDVVYDVPNAVLMEQKKFVKAGLSVDNFRIYVGQIVDEVVKFATQDEAFVELQNGSTEGSVDIFKTMCEVTILTASRTLQGQEVRDSLDKTFADLYHDLDGGFIPLNFAIPNLPIPSNFRRDKAQKAMSDFYMQIIEQRRKSQAGSKDGRHDMIEALMDQSYKNGRKLGDREIAHIMIALLMAGQHTSSATGSWAMLRLASRPEIIERLYAEQKEVYDDGAGGLRELDYDIQKNSVPLMDAVVRETLRLHPPIHSIMRKVKTDIAVPASLASPQSHASAASSAANKKTDAGYVIPKDYYVMAAPGVSQTDPKIWKDPASFNPDRWMGKGELEPEEQGETVDYGWGAISSGANSPYLPFGAGRHRCIGEQFAYLQLGTILATFVRRYSWKLATRFPDPDYNSMIVLPKAPNNRIVLKKRS